MKIYKIERWGTRTNMIIDKLPPMKHIKNGDITIISNHKDGELLMTKSFFKDSDSGSFVDRGFPIKYKDIEKNYIKVGIAIYSSSKKIAYGYEPYYINKNFLELLEEEHRKYIEKKLIM